MSQSTLKEIFTDTWKTTEYNDSRSENVEMSTVGRCRRMPGLSTSTNWPCKLIRPAQTQPPHRRPHSIRLTPLSDRHRKLARADAGLARTRHCPPQGCSARTFGRISSKEEAVRSCGYGGVDLTNDQLEGGDEARDGPSPVGIKMVLQPAKAIVQAATIVSKSAYGVPVHS